LKARTFGFALSLISLAGCSGHRKPVPNPTVTGPVTGGRGQAFDTFPVADLGYTEEEYFYSGTASTYTSVGTWERDGFWQAKPLGAANYKVRMLVRRPSDATRFNGTVIVGWLNVTEQVESASDFHQMQEEIVREGYAWVGLGVQAAGILSPEGLKAWDPGRYGSLEHPGDNYAYDIFSQGGQAIHHPQGIDPLHGLRIRRMLAVGKSEAASMLVGYINAVQPLTGIYDGYLVHSRAGGNNGYPENLRSVVPQNALIRIDVDVPVLELQMEGDLVALRSHVTRQEESKHFRLWEVAGAANAESPRWVIEVPPALTHRPPFDETSNCRDPINAAPGHAVVKAALHALMLWTRDGTEPPTSPFIELDDPVEPDPIARDRYGNAKGGIRLPEVEVPTAMVSGRENTPADDARGKLNFCALFGTTSPFDRATLAQLYPNHEAFVKAFDASVDAIQKASFWLKPEADEARKAAENSHIGR